MRLAGLTARACVVDTRNLLDPDVVDRAGFTWTGVGRGGRTAPDLAVTAT